MASIRRVLTRNRQPDVPSGSPGRGDPWAHAQRQGPRDVHAALRRGAARLRDARARGWGHRQPAHGDPLRDTKNRHDRIVPLPPSALEALRTYWRETRPKGKLLFASPYRPARGHTRNARDDGSRACERRCRRLRVSAQGGGRSPDRFGGDALLALPREHGRAAPLGSRRPALPRAQGGRHPPLPRLHGHGDGLRRRVAGVGRPITPP
jgi:hypothetical protein